MNNTNKEVEDIVEEFERKLTNEDWSNMNVADVGKHSKRHSEWLHKALNQAKEQGVQESTDTIATALGACKMGITKNKTTEEVLTELLKALTTQEDQLIVKDHE